MLKESQPFGDTFELVKLARPTSCPNPGFMDQLKNFRPQDATQANGSGHD